MSDKIKNIIELKNINKSFPGVKALTDVNLKVRAGEVHALLGENGAGKSTLIKIIMGVYQKTSGVIHVDGEEIEIKNPIQAREKGLGAVYQDVNLAQHLSVAENLFMGKLPKTKFGTLDYKKACEETKDILESLDIFVNPKAIISKLSIAQQEMVAIAKIIHEKAKLVIFDEPTALLTNDETEQLFKIIDKLKKEDVGIIYISHRMEEIFEICDRATVLKDGKWVNTVEIKDTDEDKLISMMVGRDVEDMYSISDVEVGEVALKISGFSNKEVFKDINFEVRKGQVFGMFGLVGSGRTEIVRSIFGADTREKGDIYVNGKKVDIRSPKEAIKEGIALLPEDRKEQGLAMKLSVNNNTNLASLDRISKLGIVNDGLAKQNANKYKNNLRIKTPSIKQLVKNLSGGNQQKVVISKWLTCNSNIFIFDEPTVGVDVGAKVEIYRLFEKLLKEGNSIILISSYLPEVMGLSSEMLVMYEGKQMGIVKRKDYDEEIILKMASGIK